MCKFIKKNEITIRANKKYKKKRLKFCMLQNLRRLWKMNYLSKLNE